MTDWGQPPAADPGRPPASGPPRVLVVGGAGVFGSRLVEGLVAAGIADAVVGGRSLAPAEALAARLRRETPGCVVEAVVLDARTVTPEALTATGATVVVDAAGPFQDAEPTVARAAIAAGIDYLDLADARGFVARFPDLDAAAKAAGTIAVTGMSSTPALSHAVLDAMTAGWRRIDRVEVGISPGNWAPRGRSVVAAILSWAGRPVRAFADGDWQVRSGWSGTVRRRIGDLGPRLLALAETADLDLLAARFRPRDAALFRAGLELPLLHRGLAAAAWLPRLGMVRSLVPLAGAVRLLAALLGRFGSDRGGMLVEAAGRDAEDRPVLARWTLVAEAGDGPFVPTLPALALIRRLTADRRSLVPGARAGAGLLPLAAFETEFARLRIRTAREVDHPVAPFEAALGTEFAHLPEAVRASHRGGPVTRLAGEAAVEGATTLPGRLVRRIFGFPPATAAVPVRVTKRLSGDGTEVWERDFGGRRFRSGLGVLGPGRVSERFGPFSFELSVTVAGDRLALAVTGWRLGPLPLPSRLAPKSDAAETVDADGRFRFDVPIDLPLLGRVVRYRGWLEPEA